MADIVPIEINPAVQLSKSAHPDIASIIVTDHDARYDLSWDRFVRLNAAAEAIKKVADRQARILDVGGFDGALALFLPDFEIDLIDPATTSGSIFTAEIANDRYDIVVSIDALEHVHPQRRMEFLDKIASIAGASIILNYPCRQSDEAQKLVLEATGNSLIEEHVDFGLPDTELVMDSLKALGFTCELLPHASLAIWTSQYITQHNSPETAKKLNRHLVNHHSLEPFSTPLYHLLICKRAESL